jgi:hypothetical protein
MEHMKTSKANFNTFKKELDKLLKIYGLVGWEVVVIHEYIDDATVTQTQADFPSRSVVFTFNTFCLSKPSVGDLRDSAHHEVLELLLWKLGALVPIEKAVQEREEVHAVVQTLINVARGKK